jgi:UDP-2,3-diacylglucosamine pyrophosphatase LpxH
MNSLVRLDTRLRCRTVFISDVHLGFPGCSAEFLADFLDRVQCDTLYLVGDIIDFWYMKKRRHWPQSHSTVLHRILEKADQRTRVVFVPGNHDEAVRPFDGLLLGQVEIRDQAIHETADGRRMLVLHGDQFDQVVRCSPWLAMLGCLAYGVLLRMNVFINRVRRMLGKDYWSLAAFLKHKVKNAVQYISSFEQAVVNEAIQHGVDGVICGHSHRAEISQMGPVLYMNCGDWVESCTALMERNDGTIELMQWRDSPQCLKLHRTDPQGDFWGGMAA